MSAWGALGPGTRVLVLTLGGAAAAGVGYLGIMASAVAFTLYFQTIRDIGPARAAYSSVVIPVIAMGFSTALEGYRWTALGVAGSAVALLGMVVALSAPRPAMKSG